ncbi:MAG: cell wall hydrolase [Clostridiales bacterium]|nr:cell wall hydrolase [Clostridiales bacterium]
MLAVRSAMTAAAGAAVLSFMVLTAAGAAPGQTVSSMDIQEEVSKENFISTQATAPIRLSERLISQEGQQLVGNTLTKSVEDRQKLRETQREKVREAQKAISEIEEERSRQAKEAAAAAEAEKHRSVVVPCSEEDYRVLTRIVQAEAGGCDMKGKILVANVVLNRVKAGEFPDSITDVVYQKSQFSPVKNGSINTCSVSRQTMEAVDRALAGEDYSQGALYFMNRSASYSGNVRWFDGQLTYLFQHDGHEFYR